MPDESTQLSAEVFLGGLLPSQYFDHDERRKLLNGEYRLLVAVLADAIRSYAANIGSRRGEQRLILAELRLWFHSADSERLFAFESICDLIGIKAEIVRKCLRTISVRSLPTRRYREHLLSVGRPATRRQRGQTRWLGSAGEANHRGERSSHLRFFPLSVIQESEEPN
jgi:hypothetical protein